MITKERGERHGEGKIGLDCSENRIYIKKGAGGSSELVWRFIGFAAIESQIAISLSDPEEGSRKQWKNFSLKTVRSAQENDKNYAK